MAKIGKTDILMLLGSDMDSFTTFINSGTAAANRFKWQFEQATEGLDFDIVQIRDKFIALRDAGTITTAALNRLNAENQLRNSVEVVTALHRYLVTVPAPDQATYQTYCSNYATGDIYITKLVGGQCYVQALAGIFNCPTAVEVGY